MFVLLLLCSGAESKRLIEVRRRGFPRETFVGRSLWKVFYVDLCGDLWSCSVTTPMLNLEVLYRKFCTNL